MLREMGVLAVQIGKQQISLSFDRLNNSHPHPSQCVPFNASMSMLPNVPPNSLLPSLSASSSTISTPKSASIATSTYTSTIQTSLFPSSSQLSFPSPQTTSSSQTAFSSLKSSSLTPLTQLSSQTVQTFPSSKTSSSSSSPPSTSFSYSLSISKNYNNSQLIYSVSKSEAKLTEGSFVTKINSRPSISPINTKFQGFSSHNLPSKLTFSSINTSLNSVENVSNHHNQNFASSSPLLVNLLRSPGSRNHTSSIQDLPESSSDSCMQLKRKSKQPKKSKRLKGTFDSSGSCIPNSVYISAKGDSNMLHNNTEQKVFFHDEKSEFQESFKPAEHDALEPKDQPTATKKEAQFSFSSLSIQKDKANTPPTNHTSNLSHLSFDNHHQNLLKVPPCNEDQRKSSPLFDSNSSSHQHQLNSNIFSNSSTYFQPSFIKSTLAHNSDSSSSHNTPQSFMNLVNFGQYYSSVTPNQNLKNFINTHISKLKNTQSDIDHTNHVNNLLKSTMTINTLTSSNNNSVSCTSITTTNNKINNSISNNNNNNFNNTSLSNNNVKGVGNKRDFMKESLYGSNGQTSAYSSIPTNTTDASPKEVAVADSTDDSTFNCREGCAIQYNMMKYNYTNCYSDINPKEHSLKPSAYSFALC